MNDPRQQQQDDLLKRARELGDKTARAADQAEVQPPGGILVRNPLLGRIMATGRALRRWTGPVGALVAWVIGRLGRAFKWAAFERENGQFVRDANGELIYSSSRFLKVSLLALAGLILLHMAVSAAYYYGTYFHETVYVTGKQEIETGELYQFGGCTSLPCSTESDNGKFYLIESSLYFPALFYPEEEVFANIPQQDGACDVEGYGIYFRSLRWLYKSAQLYQHVVDVSCRPYTEEEIGKAVDSGQIVGSDPATGN